MEECNIPVDYCQHQLILFSVDFYQRNDRKRNNRYILKFNDHTQAMNIPHHQGSFMFFRIECFNKTGLFDERFFMYLEDIDLTRRIHKYYRTMFWPGVTIVHAHRAASYKSKRCL